MPEATASDSDSDGVWINLLSGNQMANPISMEKIRLILDGVRDGNIIVPKEDLSFDEGSRLIEVTMAEVNPDEFNDIGIETYPRSWTVDQSFLDRLMGRQSTQRLMVTDLANQIQTPHKNENLTSALIS